MNHQITAMLTPSILIVDDERQIHSSLRLRLGENYELSSLFSPKEALAAVQREQFDLCFVDLHMPDMDGLGFIEAARELDPALGFVVLTGYGSEENLRRAIPLQVLDFLAKPLPDRDGFEKRIPEWIARTRTRRHELALTRDTLSLVEDLEVARLEREVELTASNSAREALLQTAGLLTTTSALLFSAQHSLESMTRSDPRLNGLLRGVAEARKHAESAATIAEGYFGSAYADRESSSAWIDTGLQHAIRISRRLAHAEERRQHIDSVLLGRDAALRHLSGIDFLMMMVPTLAQSLEFTPAESTLQLHCIDVSRLDRLPDDPLLRSYLWVNRRNSLGSAPAVVISIKANAPAPAGDTMKTWLGGATTEELKRSSRGLLHGVQKAKGILGVATRPKSARFEFVIGLPI